MERTTEEESLSHVSPLCGSARNLFVCGMQNNYEMMRQEMAFYADLFNKYVVE